MTNVFSMQRFLLIMCVHAVSSCKIIWYKEFLLLWCDAYRNISGEHWSDSQGSGGRGGGRNMSIYNPYWMLHFYTYIFNVSLILVFHRWLGSFASLFLFFVTCLYRMIMFCLSLHIFNVCVIFPSVLQELSCACYPYFSKCFTGIKSCFIAILFI